MVSFDVESLFTNIPLLESMIQLFNIFCQVTRVVLQEGTILNSYSFSPRPKLISPFRVFVTIRQMALPWAPLLHRFSLIFTRDTMKRYGFNSMRVLVFTFSAGMSTIPFVYSTTTRTQWHFSIYQQSGSRWRGRSIISCLSQMFSIDNNNLPFPITSVFRTYTGLFTNFHSFVPFSQKLDLVRTLVDRVSKINYTWLVSITT